jgi:glyoxylase-like metal-dependent hydrolase (beta-lactamase superfamily II)
MPVIHTIDLHYLGEPGMIAAYVVIGPEGPVLIETGPASCLDALESGLTKLGISLDHIRHALVTHIHLDHAGAAGHLAERGVTIHVHEFGAPHLIDPTKLIASASRIYGHQMDRLWGTIKPAPAARVVPVRDGERLELAGLRLTALATPGHAKHHHAYELVTDRGLVCFTGDAAGMIIPGDQMLRQFINLPTPPPEFDLAAWLDSVIRLETRRYTALYLTHFGEVNTPPAHFAAVRQALRRHTDFVIAQCRVGAANEQLNDAYAQWVRQQAKLAGATEQQVKRFVTDNLLRMNVTGIVRYLDQQSPQAV